ncbi:MAG: hypothetical protein K2O94_01370, partial [Clostridiales bacterium]|nr:hypothetical protein [Clostridiales bacterium]
SERRRRDSRTDIVWKIACLLFALLAVVFAVMYFSGGGTTETTSVNMDGVQIETGGDNNDVSIGSTSYEIAGTAETKDNTIVICMTIVASVAVLLIGGILIVLSKKNT